MAYRPDAEAIKGKPVNLGLPLGAGCKSIFAILKGCRRQSGTVPQL